MIATEYLSRLRDEGTERKLGSLRLMWNEPLLRFNPGSEEAPELYDAFVEDFLQHSAYVAQVLSMFAEDEILAIRHEDFVARPKEGLREICAFLGLGCSEAYLNVCASRVFSTPHRSRGKVRWTPKQVQAVAQAIERYPWLDGYAYD